MRFHAIATAPHANGAVVLHHPRDPFAAIILFRPVLNHPKCVPASATNSRILPGSSTRQTDLYHKEWAVVSDSTGSKALNVQAKSLTAGRGREVGSGIRKGSCLLRWLRNIRND